MLGLAPPDYLTPPERDPPPQPPANARATVRENFSEEICTAAWVELLGSLGKSQRLGRLKMPRRFRLPPVNPKFGLQDNRPSLWQQVWRGFRRFGGRCKRQLWQQLGH